MAFGYSLLVLLLVSDAVELHLDLLGVLTDIGKVRELFHPTQLTAYCPADYFEILAIVS